MLLPVPPPTIDGIDQADRVVQHHLPFRRLFPSASSSPSLHSHSIAIIIPPAPAEGGPECGSSGASAPREDSGPRPQQEGRQQQQQQREQQQQPPEQPPLDLSLLHHIHFVVQQLRWQHQQPAAVSVLQLPQSLTTTGEQRLIVSPSAPQPQWRTTATPTLTTPASATTAALLLFPPRRHLSSLPISG